MGQDVRMRKQTTVDFETNGVVSEKLSRGMVYRELWVKLVGAATLAGANNTQAKTLKGDEWACVKKIEIIANNTDVLFSLTGNQLWWWNFYQMGNRPHVTPGIGDGATANAPFTSALMIPFWMPRSIRPIDTALDARNLSDLQIRVTWGTYTDNNADASAWTTEPKLYVYSLESTKVKGPFATQRVYYIEKVISATNSQFQIQLPVGPVYRSFLFNTEDAGKDAGSILNNIKIKSGTTVFVDLPNAILEQINGWLRNGTQHPFDAGAAANGAYDECRRGTTYNLRAGWRYLDLVTDNFMTEAIDTLGFSEFELELDVTVGAGTTKIFVIPQTVIPVRGKS